MSAAAKDLADIPPAQFDLEVDRFRRQSVDEAVLNIKEKLKELDAIPTLARLTRNKATYPTAAALGLGAVQLM